MTTYYFPGVLKQIRKARLKAVLWTLLFSGILGVALGYGWHYSAVTERHKEELAKKDETIQYYREYWTPIRDYKQAPVKERVK